MSVLRYRIGAACPFGRSSMRGSSAGALAQAPDPAYFSERLGACTGEQAQFAVFGGGA
jgi:hypothetical protein